MRGECVAAGITRDIYPDCILKRCLNAVLFSTLSDFMCLNQETRAPAGSRRPSGSKPKPSGFDGASGAHLVVVDELFLHHFHGVDALRLLQLHQQHLGVAASSDHPQQLEVCQAQAGRRFASFPTSPRLGGGWVGVGGATGLNVKKSFKKNNFEITD